MAKKRKKRKLPLFLGTLFLVLLCGGVLLVISLWLNGAPAEKGSSENNQQTQGFFETETAETEKQMEENPSGSEKNDSGEWEKIETESTETEAAEQQGGKYDHILQDAVYMEAENIHVRDAMEEDVVTLCFAGDVLFDDAYSIMVHMRQKGEGMQGCFSDELLQIMRDADVFMLNNEFPYSNRGEPLEDKTFTFRANPESAAFLYDMGADVVSLANNHAYDYGEVALLDSLRTLEEKNIPYVGAGENLEEASAPVYFIINDLKIGILSATQIERLDNPDTKGATENSPGVFRCWDSSLLVQRIKEVKEQCDFLVVFVHWGTENTDELDWAQRDQSVEYAEAGADLIIGAHPHCLQEIQMIHGVPVFFSLGNFWFNSKTIDTGLVKVTISAEDASISSLQFIPAIQKGCETRLLTGSEKTRVLSYMRGLSQTVGIDEEGYVY